MSFRLERAKANGGLPNYRELPIANGQAWRKGAILTKNANGQVEEIAGPTAAIGTIAGVAESDAGTGNGPLTPLGSREFPPGFMQVIPATETFEAQYVGTLPTVDSGTATYGLIRDTDGQWKVNFADTANGRVRLVTSKHTATPTRRNIVIVKFLPGTQDLF